MDIGWMHYRHAELTREATQLAGSLSQLAQRATVYRHLYLASGGNHAFPLIAAHGALWASGYFQWGMGLGKLLSWQYLGRPSLRAKQWERLEAFADTFRDINRRVCIDSYINFYFAEEFGDHPAAEEFLSAELLGPLKRMHAARDAGKALSAVERQDLFTAHFLHEQKTVVGPSLTAAVEEFAWPLVRAIALRPSVRFSYFPPGMRLWFRNFASQDERIERGQIAFQIGAELGWDKVDAALEQYQVLPTACFSEPQRHYSALKQSVLAIPA